MTQKNSKNKSGFFLWTALGVLLIALLFVRVLFADIIGFTILVAVPLIVVMGLLIRANATSLRGRTAAYSINSIVTVLLILGIVGVLNFLGERYPQKLDLTKNKSHTLSDQTTKLVKGLNKTVKATMFVSTAQREKYRMLLDNYKSLNPKFEWEYVDPVREPVRTRAANIHKDATLLLSAGVKTNSVEDPSEEKLTNGLIKLLKDKTQTLCSLTGHGEKSFNSSDNEGYGAAKTSMGNQLYTVKEVSLLQEGKIPADCDAIAILGPNKSYFKAEADQIKDYLANGGRAIMALDINFKGTEFTPELLTILQDWHIKAEPALIMNKRYPQDMGVTASVIALFEKDSPITKDFKYESIFPAARPLEIIPGQPPGMDLKLVARSLPDSYLLTDLKNLSAGSLKITGQEKTGPSPVAVSVEGKLKDSKASRNTRLIVFGTSLFGVNGMASRGGNLDFFLNAVSWIMEDESLISIRTKEDAPSKVELSSRQSGLVFIITVLLIPALIAVAGIVIWILRKKL